MKIRRRLQEPYWRRAPMWVPAPRPVVTARAAGVEPSALSTPSALERFAAPPVFICGSARSGTTWAFDLFDRHPLVCAVCETWLLSQTHGLTSVMTQEYWDVAAKRAWEERVDVPFGTVQLIPYDEMARELADLIARWLVRPAKPEHRYLAAKEPLDVRAASILFPRARFIHVIRDGRDVALSMKHASETWDPSMGVGCSMEMRAEAWRRQVENVRAHRQELGERYLEIRYEEMRADPTAAMRRLFGFAGVTYDEETLAAIRSSTQLSAYSEKARRSGFRGGSGARGSRRAFSSRDAIGFELAAGALLRELGYVRGRRWVAPYIVGSLRRSTMPS